MYQSVFSSWCVCLFSPPLLLVTGTSASALHFQVYLLEGLARWNEDRARAAVEDGDRTTLRCYSARLQHGFDRLTQEFLGQTLVENYTRPGEYTGNLTEGRGGDMRPTALTAV